MARSGRNQAPGANCVHAGYGLRAGPVVGAQTPAVVSAGPPHAFAAPPAVMGELCI